jgi:hypothetical protein
MASEGRMLTIINIAFCQWANEGMKGLVVLVAVVIVVVAVAVALNSNAYSVILMPSIIRFMQS